MAQGHWQYSTTSVAAGLLKESSILLDESRSGINALQVQNLTRRDFKYLNLLEVDNVCDQGPQLLAALRANYPHP